jgi:hypothetical protein
MASRPFEESIMGRYAGSIFSALLITGSLAACIPAVPLVPGADRVKITQNPADVAACTPVGNIDSGIVPGPSDFVAKQMRNQAVGLGGNVVFDTTVGGALGPADKKSGVIFRCGSVAPGPPTDGKP